MDRRCHVCCVSHIRRKYHAGLMSTSLSFKFSPFKCTANTCNLCLRWISFMCCNANVKSFRLTLRIRMSLEGQLFPRGRVKKAQRRRPNLFISENNPLCPPIVHLTGVFNTLKQMLRAAVFVVYNRVTCRFWETVQCLSKMN